MGNLISKRFLAMLSTEIGFCYIISMIPFAYWKDKLEVVLVMFCGIFGAYLGQRWNEKNGVKKEEVKTNV